VFIVSVGETVKLLSDISLYSTKVKREIPQTVGDVVNKTKFSKNYLPQKVLENFNRTCDEDKFISHHHHQTPPIEKFLHIKRENTPTYHGDKPSLAKYFDNYTAVEETEDLAKEKQSKSQEWIQSVVEELDKRDLNKFKERSAIIGEMMESARVKALKLM
jgi:hypothetical protein